MGGKGRDEREKQEVTLHIKLPFIEGKQQRHTVFFVTSIINYLATPEMSLQTVRTANTKYHYK